MPAPAGLEYVVADRRHRVVGLALALYRCADEPCVEPLYVEDGAVRVGTSRDGVGELLPRGTLTEAQREAAAAQREAAAAEARRSTEERNRDVVVRTLRERPAGVAKADLLAALRGRSERRRRLLAELARDGVTFEYKGLDRGRVIVRLRPKEAPTAA
jgi:hypothetical protein